MSIIDAQFAPSNARDNSRHTWIAHSDGHNISEKHVLASCHGSPRECVERLPSSIPSSVTSEIRTGHALGRHIT